MFSLYNEKILLRALEPYDLDFIYNCENNTKNWKVSGTTIPFSKNLISKYIEHYSADIYTDKQLRLIIEKKPNNEQIGIIDLFDFDVFNSRAGVGILIASKKNKRKGYALEALQLIIDYSFKHLLLNQLYCNISIENIASKELFIKAGFVESGIKKQWNKTLNGWEDELFFQLLKV